MGCCCFKAKGNIGGDDSLHSSSISMLKKETSFTEREIQEWYEKFIDDYPSGRITIEDFKHEYNISFPKADVEALSELIFKAYDLDNNGTLDFKEFLTGLYMTSKGDVEKKLRWAFRVYDKDGDGSITRDEMHEVLTAMGKVMRNKQAMSKERAEQLVNIIDVNHDNLIVLEEFIEAIKNDPELMKEMTKLIC